MDKELLELIEAKVRVSQSSDKNIIAKLKYDFVIGEKQNSNKRVYGDDILELGIGRFNAQLKKQKIAGQLNHPIIPGSELDKIGHALTSVSYDRQTHKGTAEAIILNTSSGRDLKVLIDTKIPFGASMRGGGTQDRDGNIKNDWKLHSIDMVSNPSYGDEVMITPANLIESGNQKLGELDLAEIGNAHHEAFLSLRSNLSNAIKDKFGKEFWLSDFSPTDAIVRKDGSDEDDSFQKISYTIKNNEVVLGDSETVKKTTDYKKEEDEKMVIKNMTLAEVKKNHPELLKEHAEEIKKKKFGSLYKRFEEARYTGYKGNFDQYKLLVESYEPVEETEPFISPNINSFSKAQKLYEEKQKEKQASKPADEKLLELRYDEAITSGYAGSFREWKQKMMAAEAIVIARENANQKVEGWGASDGAWPHEILASEKLERELTRKAEIKSYESDIKAGLWVGTFREWMLDKREQRLNKARGFNYPS